MDYAQIVDMLEEFNLPFAYDHFAEGESPPPPFVVFLFPKSRHFAADGKVYFKKGKLRIELYTELKLPPLEMDIEAVLDEHGLFYQKSETWIASERLYEVLYEMEV